MDMLCLPEQRVVQVGNWKHKQFNPVPAKEYHYDEKVECLAANGVHNLPSLYGSDEGKVDRQVINKFFAERLGPAFNRRLWKMSFRAHVADHFPEKTWFAIKLAGKNWKWVDKDKLNAAHGAKPYVCEAYKDGLLQLIPFIVHFRKPPQEIRKTVGRAAWRRIANNSATRNVNLVNCCASPGSFDPRLLDVSTSALRNFQGSIFITRFTDYIHYADRVAQSKSRQHLDEAFDLVRDADRMDGFNPNWGLARLRREHDEAAERRVNAQYSDEPFCDPFETEIYGIKITRLVSQKEVALEGQRMRHCLASYAFECHHRVYVAFHMADANGKATLGACVRDGQLRLDQIYGPCNSPAPRGFKAAARELISRNVVAA